jgi:hypothetical protein
MLSKGHIIQTLLYMVQFVGGYFLMLALMTYNAWLMIGGILGLGLGYFLFGWLEEVQCQEMVAPQRSRRPTGECGLSNRLDCGFKGKEQELRPLSIADGGDMAGDGTVACQCECGETST